MRLTHPQVPRRANGQQYDEMTIRPVSRALFGGNVTGRNTKRKPCYRSMSPGRPNQCLVRRIGWIAGLQIRFTYWRNYYFIKPLQRGHQLLQKRLKIWARRRRPLRVSERWLAQHKLKQLQQQDLDNLAHLQQQEINLGLVSIKKEAQL